MSNEQSQFESHSSTCQARWRKREVGPRVEEGGGQDRKTAEEGGGGWPRQRRKKESGAREWWGSNLALISKEANVCSCVDHIFAATYGLVKGLRLVQLCLHHTLYARYGECYYLSPALSYPASLVPLFLALSQVLVLMYCFLTLSQ